MVVYSIHNGHGKAIVEYDESTIDEQLGKFYEVAHRTETVAVKRLPKWIGGKEALFTEKHRKPVTAIDA